jgi:hypothetical protein
VYINIASSDSTGVFARAIAKDKRSYRTEMFSDAAGVLRNFSMISEAELQVQLRCPSPPHTPQNEMPALKAPGWLCNWLAIAVPGVAGAPLAALHGPVPPPLAPSSSHCGKRTPPPPPQSLEALSKAAAVSDAEEAALEEELGDAPDEFLDPIMSELMRDPVILPTSNTTMDR